jgi:hypothetical protein
MAEDDQVVDILTRVRTDPGLDAAQAKLRQFEAALKDFKQTAARRDAAADQEMAALVRGWEKATSTVKNYNQS